MADFYWKRLKNGGFELIQIFYYKKQLNFFKTPGCFLNKKNSIKNL